MILTGALLRLPFLRNHLSVKVLWILRELGGLAQLV